MVFTRRPENPVEFTESHSAANISLRPAMGFRRLAPEFSALPIKAPHHRRFAPSRRAPANRRRDGGLSVKSATSAEALLSGMKGQHLGQQSVDPRGVGSLPRAGR